MIEVTIFTVVVAHPDAPSVVVLTQKSAAANMFNIPGMPQDRASAGYQDMPTPKTTSSDSLGDAAAEVVGEAEEPLLLPIWIGFSEAEAIMHMLEGQQFARPLTYDLLSNTIGALGSRVERVVIDRVQGSTFFASISLNRDGRIITIDARPSDSIALALRTGARIYVDEDVMNAAARQFRVRVSDAGDLLYSSEDEMERFRSFIESVSPEDFKR